MRATTKPCRDVLLCGVLLCAAAAGPAGAQHTVLEAAGLSAAIPAAGPSLPAGGARAMRIGGEDEVLVKLGGEFMTNPRRRGGKAGLDYGHQTRFGIDIFQTWADGVFLGGVFGADWDRAGDGGERRYARVVSVAAEAGYYLTDRRGTRELLVSGTVGKASIGSVNGVETVQSLSGPKTQEHRGGRGATALGLSVAGRLGEPGNRGTILVHGDGSALLKAGTRSSVSADVNLSKRWQLGVSVRQVELTDPGRPALRILRPMIRATWGNF